MTPSSSLLSSHLQAPPQTSTSASTSANTVAQQALVEKIHAKTAKVAIVGMGYVGLPLAVCVSKVGFKVTGIDLNAKRIDRLNHGESYIEDVATETLKPLVESGSVTGTIDFGVLSDADVIIICVPTPLTKNRDPDVSYIEATCKEIAKRLRPGQLISLESTTYPGTTEEVMLPLFAQTGLKVGEDYFLVHSPERVDPGNARYTTQNTNKILGGHTPACTEVGTVFYRKSILDVIAVSSTSCAEMVKVFENTFRAVNIALVNELALLCDKMNLNVWEVVEAAGTKPFGMMSFQPGPGVGGHCIPIDPFYLTWKAREFNFHTRFIELAGEINASMPYFVREKVIRALGMQGKPLYGSKILMMGLAYKADLPDWRHSPAVDIFEILQHDGASVYYHDPFIPTWNGHPSQPYSDALFASVDCVVITTNHSQFNAEDIVAKSPMVVDTRNACRNVLTHREKIILL